MRRLAILLWVIGAPAWAAWTSVGEEPTGSVYADPATIVKNGDSATMSSLTDYKSFQRMVEVGYYSQVARVEYDCAGHRSRGLSLALHADQMGQGKVVYSDETAQDWEEVAPGTITEKLWSIACR